MLARHTSHVWRKRVWAWQGWKVLNKVRFHFELAHNSFALAPSLPAATATEHGATLKRLAEKFFLACHDEE